MGNIGKYNWKHEYELTISFEINIVTGMIKKLVLFNKLIKSVKLSVSNCVPVWKMFAREAIF